jgi:hypothetical protein
MEMEMKNMLNEYTVVLLYPDWASSQYGEDTYLAFVEARTFEDAVSAAQEEALEDWMTVHQVTKEDLDQGYPPEPAEDFVALAVFEGYCRLAIPESWT